MTTGDLEQLRGGRSAGRNFRIVHKYSRVLLAGIRISNCPSLLARGNIEHTNRAVHRTGRNVLGGGVEAGREYFTGVSWKSPSVSTCIYIDGRRNLTCELHDRSIKSTGTRNL